MGSYERSGTGSGLWSLLVAHADMLRPAARRDACLILFGAGKIPRVMGDVAKGIKSFKAGLKDDDTVDDATPPVTTTTVPPRETRTPV